MTVPGGYILQPRCIDSSDIMHEPPVVRELWFYLLRRVNHEDNGRFERGTNFFNLGDVQEALHWYVGYRKERYSKPQLTKAMRRLCERNMIETTKATRGLVVSVLNYSYYQDPGNYERNGERNTKETRKKHEGTHYKQEGRRKKEETYSAEQIPFQNIIAYLNEQAGKKYNHKSEGHRKHIRARWHEGHCENDFYSVIDKKVAEWQDQPKMNSYLRPETLFNGRNFDKYLNQPSGGGQNNTIVKDGKKYTFGG